MTERVKEQDKIGGWDGEGGEDTEEAKKTRGNSQVKGKGMEDGLKKNMQRKLWERRKPLHCYWLGG